MAYTNKTINYELPQYVGSDKPSYLNDFNYAMSTIDAQMKTNANSASSAGSNATQALNTANEADGKVGNLQNLNTTDKSNVVNAINEVLNSGGSSLVGDLTNLHTTDKTNCVNAINETYDNLISLMGGLNLSNFIHITSTSDSHVSTKTHMTLNSIAMNVAYSSDKTVAKIYGEVNFTTDTSSSGDNSLTLTNVGNLNQTGSNIVIASAGSCFRAGSSIPSGAYLVLETNGNIKLVAENTTANTQSKLTLYPCLIFLKNFGDEPNS